MQSINQPQAAILAGMQQGGNLSQYQQGQLAFADGGLASLGRDMYAGGGTAIGGGNYTGIPMGNRTGFGLLINLLFLVSLLQMVVLTSHSFHHLIFQP